MINNNIIDDDDVDKRVKIELTDTASNVHDKEGNLDCSAGGAEHKTHRPFLLPSRNTLHISSLLEFSVVRSYKSVVQGVSFLLLFFFFKWVREQERIISLMIFDVGHVEKVSRFGFKTLD